MDLKKNRLLIGILALLVLCVAGVMLMNQQEEEDRPVDDEDEVASLLPDLDKDAISEVEIQRPDEPVIRLVKDGDTWSLAEPVAAEADEGVVNTMLTKLDELAAERVAATNAENHERLAVTEELGIRVIARGEGSDLINMLVGGASSGNTMVRLDGEDRVIAASGSIQFAFNKTATEWRNKQILDETSSEINQIQFASPDGNFTFLRNDEDEWVGAEGQAEIERFEGSKVQSIVASLARMRAVDFGAEDLSEDAAGFTQPPAEGEEESLTAPAVVTLTVGGSDEEPARTVVLRASESGPEDGKFYLMREGNPTVFVISSFSKDRIRVTTDSFQAPEEGEEEEAEAPPEMPAMPGGPGGQQLPPEIMRQLQQQLGMAGP